MPITVPARYPETDPSSVRSAHVSKHSGFAHSQNPGREGHLSQGSWL